MTSSSTMYRRSQRTSQAAAPQGGPGGLNGFGFGHRLQVTTAFLVLATLTVAIPVRSRAAQTPQEVVDKTASEVLAILADQSLSSDDKRRKIEDVVDARVDFMTLSRLVLARNWNRLSPGQQREFVQEFRKHLSVTYGRNVDSYRNESVNIIGGREEARGDYTVLSKIVRGGPDDVSVNYRLRQRDGTWKIIDIIIEGVSLVSNFRSQFQDIIAKEGPDKLLELLREKNVRGEPLKS